MSAVVDFPTSSGEALLTARIDAIPALLRAQARWVIWTKTKDGKVPRAIRRPSKDADATKPTNWATFADFEAASQKLNGPGFALGRVDDDLTIAGVDIDDCRDPKTGVIEPWAFAIIHDLKSYAEVSPSGTGVKIFLAGNLPKDAKQGKVYRLEVYDHARYFTVTGHHVPGTPLTVEPRERELRALYSRQRSTDLVERLRLFGLFVSDRGEWIDIRCPWHEDHSGEDGPRDCGLHLKDGKVDGFECFHASHADKKLPDVLKLFGLTGSSDFLTTPKGGILANSQENVLRALDKLGVTVARDTFAQKTIVTSGNKTLPFDDATAVFLWLTIDERFKFLPSKEFFIDVLQNAARKSQFHPVCDYLNGLAWDGEPRIDTWLCRYGGAKTTSLNQAIGAIVLIAAVRRVRQPGCKFDELLVLIAHQGTDKSSALRALCPQESWFTDDLPLNVDAKQIIERTAGKWIIEAAELNGLGKREADHLKASLSRQVDGPVRQAYGRLPVEVPRQFITIGTTNTHQFLKDKTGNRRFWPVKVGKFDLAALQRDRDQLWAEAAAREARGESIRLDPSLYAAATKEQEERQIDDAWAVTLATYLSVEDDGRSDVLGKQPPMDRVLLEDIWIALGFTPDRRDERAAERISAVMQSLGYEKKQSRGLNDDKRSAKRWCRVTGQMDLPEAGDE